MKYKKRTLKERIESHIISKEGCWLTDYYINPKDGRPKITVDGETRQLARVVYEVFKKESPGELCVCHTCDNPSCINPDHLWLGTYADNNTDKVKKDRQLKGILVPSSKLTDSQIVEIKQLLREDRLSFREIAQQFDVTPSAIDKINSGINWKHIGSTNSRIRKGVGSKLDYRDVVLIKMMLVHGISHKKIADVFEVSQHTIGEIERGNTWRNVTVDITCFDEIEPSIHAGKLQLDDVLQIKKMLFQGKSRREIANLFGVSPRFIGAIALGDAWKHVTID
jgi:transposase